MAKAIIKRPGGKVAGFTLLEVLVAVVVLSIGLLGLASLQVNGLRFSHSAYLRSQATALAYELADRMRANTPGLASYNTPTTAPLLALVPACRTFSTNGCTPAQMAQNDVAEWQRALANDPANGLNGLLPNGRGVVCRDTTNPPATADDGTPAAPACDGGPTWVIKIWWDDNRTGDPTQFQRLVVAPF